jgi:hypothetical protein
MARQTRSQHTGQFVGRHRTPAEIRRTWAESALSIFKASRNRSIADKKYVVSSYDTSTSGSVLFLSEIMLLLAEEGWPLDDIIEKAKAVAMLQHLADS